METIPFARPFIGREEEEAALRVLRSGWLTTGVETAEFEKEFRAFFAEEPLYCMAVNSATSGLHLALEACGVRKGALVLVPSMTFTATAEVVRYLGAEVVFVDTAPGRFHMDPAALETTLERLKAGLPAYRPLAGERAEGLGPRGKAKVVIPVHYGGLPCDMEAILSIAKTYGVKVIEDAAHSFPSFVPAKDGGEGGRWAGLSGNAGVFSFYATKTITTGEGGMVVTRDEKIASRVKIMRSHGIDREVWLRYTKPIAAWYYDVVAPGFKYNIPDLLSAIGREQLKRAYFLLEARREIAARYDGAFGEDPRFTVPFSGEGDARHLYPLRINRALLSVGRNEFAARLQEGGIGISVHFIPLHMMRYYKERYWLLPWQFPETRKCFEEEISLPIWPGMTAAQVDRVITVVKDTADKYTV